MITRWWVWEAGYVGNLDAGRWIWFGEDRLVLSAFESTSTKDESWKLEVDAGHILPISIALLEPISIALLDEVRFELTQRRSRPRLYVKDWTYEFTELCKWTYSIWTQSQQNQNSKISHVMWVRFSRWGPHWSCKHTGPSYLVQQPLNALLLYHSP